MTGTQRKNDAPPMIEVSGLQKKFRRRSPAVDDIFVLR